MSHPLDFTGKVALVTGAAAGMGLATAQAFVNAGASVVLADINEAAVKDTVAEITKAGGAALAIQTDVSKGPDVKRMVDEAVAKFGALDPRSVAKPE